MSRLMAIFRAWRDVRLEPDMRMEADVVRFQVYGFTP
jgi:hypothetical protein